MWAAVSSGAEAMLEAAMATVTQAQGALVSELGGAGMCRPRLASKLMNPSITIHPTHISHCHRRKSPLIPTLPMYVHKILTQAVFSSHHTCRMYAHMHARADIMDRRQFGAAGWACLTQCRSRISKPAMQLALTCSD